jgi:hypothetical protein
MPKQYGSNALRADGTSFNVGNVLGDKPSIKLFSGEYNTGSEMQKVLTGGTHSPYTTASSKASSSGSGWSVPNRLSLQPPSKPKPKLTGENEEWAKQRLMDGLLHGRVKDVRVAIEDGIDVNYKDKRGDTPLHHAAKNGKYKMAQLLLDLGGVRRAPPLPRVRQLARRRGRQVHSRTLLTPPTSRRCLPSPASTGSDHH